MTAKKSRPQGLPIQYEIKLRKQMDALLASMQSTDNRNRLDAFFDMTPEQLGEAAVEAVRNRREK